MMDVLQKIELTARAHAAIAESLANLSGEEALKGTTIEKALMVKESRAVFTGRMAGEKIIYKIIFGEHAKAHTLAQQAELRATYPFMCEGPLQVPRPIAFFPDKGLSVMSRAQGRRLSDLLLDAPRKRKKILLRQSGAWLAKFTALRQRSNPLAAGHWAKKRAETLHLFDNPEDRALAERLQVDLDRQAAALGGAPITQARSHGDFCSLNMVFGNGVMTGVDLQSETWLPVAKDAARFLAYHAILQPSPNGDFQHGLNAREVDAFLSSGVLDGEPEGLLRFFIGIELAGRLLNERRYPDIHAACFSAITRYLS